MPNTFQIYMKEARSKQKLLNQRHALIDYEMYADNSFLQSTISINLNGTN